jgi:hypothetical protein
MRLLVIILECNDAFALLCGFSRTVPFPHESQNNQQDDIMCHVGPALPAPTTRSGAATTGKLIGRQIGIQDKLIDRQIGIEGKLIGIQGKLIGMQGKRESRSLFPLLADHISIYWM